MRVLGRWRYYATLSSLEVTSGIVELLVGEYRLGLAGEADECDWHGWDLPESAGAPLRMARSAMSNWLRYY